MTRIAMLVWNEFRNDARVLKQAQTLQSAGYLVTVFALHTPGVTRSKETLMDGTRVVRVARRPLWRWRRVKAQQSPSASAAGTPMTILRVVARLWTHIGLIARIAGHRATVIHAHDVNTLPSAWLAARLSGAKLVYDAHELSTSREGYGRYRKWVALIERTLMPRTDGNITTTETRAKFFARAYAIARPQVLQNRPPVQQQPADATDPQRTGAVAALADHRLSGRIAAGTRAGTAVAGSGKGTGCLFRADRRRQALRAVNDVMQ